MTPLPFAARVDLHNALQWLRSAAGELDRAGHPDAVAVGVMANTTANILAAREPQA